VSDRELDLAVSAFAPGAQIVKDGWVHTVSGFVAYKPFGQGFIAVDNPLGPEHQLGRCENPECGAHFLNFSEGQTCQVCGQANMVFAPMYQPAGFRTDYNRVEFEDEDADLAPMAGPVQLVSGDTATASMSVGRVTLNVFDQANTVKVNDNYGSGFNLRMLPDNSCVVLNSEIYEADSGPTSERKSDISGAFIGSIRKSDVLVAELNDLPLPFGIVRTDNEAGRAAFWSFSEALRKGCEAALDLPPQELIVGLHAKRVNTAMTSSVFVADALENGAGYAVDLGNPQKFSEILQSLRTDLSDKWLAPEHNCSSSCPDCLRSYDNRRIHGQLNWRLALDLVDLASGSDLDLARWFDSAGELLAGFVSLRPSLAVTVVAELPVLRDESSKKAVVFSHPLWSLQNENLVSHQIEAQHILASEGYTAVHRNFYDVDRKPISILESFIN
jgi:DEAD/DEAH box helicase domain-containing protein